MAEMYAGYHLEVDITDFNGDEFAAVIGRLVVEAEAPELPVDNTEGLPGNPAHVAAHGYGASLTGIKKAHATLEFVTFMDEDSVLSPTNPIAIRESLPFSMVVYPIGRDGGVAWPFEGFFCTKLRYEGVVRGLQPITIEASSDGLYTFAGLIEA